MTKYYRDTKYEIRQNIQPKIAPLTAAVSGALAAGSLQAATITVDTLNDGLNNGECTLRSALYSASQNSATNACVAGEAGTDTIVFDSAISGTIDLGTSGLYFDGSTLPIGESVTIDGDNRITVSGTGDSPVFYAKYDDTTDYNAGTVQMAQITITGGGGARGGGVLSYADVLQLSDVTIDNNTAADAGAGVWHAPYNGSGEFTMLAGEISYNIVTGAGGYAGGVGLSAPFGMDVTVSGALFDTNTVADGGGAGLHLDIADFAYVDVKYSTFENNNAKYGNGGGIQALVGYAQVDLTENTFNSNEAYYAGGGVYLRENADFAGYQQAEIDVDQNQFTNNSAGTTGGGASITIENGSSGTLENPVKFVEFRNGNQFTGNEAASGGGGLSLTLTDTITADFQGGIFGSNTSAAGGAGALLADINASQITFQDSEFSGNQAQSGNGGAANIAVSDGAFYASGVLAVSNETYSGGAGAFQVSASNSDFGFEYSSFYSNTATDCGGALRVTGTPNEVGVGHSIFAGNQGSCGGAMSLFAPASSNILVEVKYSEFSGNTATSASSATGGGAIFSEFASGSTVIVKNSTISGNDSAGYAGGIRFNGDLNADVKYATIANNYAYDQGGGIYNTSTSCSIDNSILAGNENQTGLYQDLRGSADCDVSNTLLAGAKYSDYTDGGGNILDTDPLLEPLSDNGGNGGWTHALQSGSPAIDAGNAGSNVPDFDQRGPAYPRIRNGVLDMGALETGPAIDLLFQDRFEQP